MEFPDIYEEMAYLTTRLEGLTMPPMQHSYTVIVMRDDQVTCGEIAIPQAARLPSSARIGVEILESIRRGEQSPKDGCSECRDWFNNPLNIGRVTAEHPLCPIRNEPCVRFTVVR